MQCLFFKASGEKLGEGGCGLSIFWSKDDALQLFLWLRFFDSPLAECSA